MGAKTNDSCCRHRRRAVRLVLFGSVHVGRRVRWPPGDQDIIVVGAKNDGASSGEDVRPVLALDSAAITDMMVKYTGEQFADFEIVRTSIIRRLPRNGRSLALYTESPPTTLRG